MFPYLVASAQRNDLQRVRDSAPELWRQVRRYNQPVQLALAAAEDVIQHSADPSAAAVISLAPCQPGSADLYRWGHLVTAGMASGNLGNLRMNPTQTLHAVDNLALSAFAIAHGNRSYCLGLGGAAGQAWCALEALRERLDRGAEEEALLIAGDQDAAEDGAAALGVALLFSVRARPYAPLGRVVRMTGVSRNKERAPQVAPHAANGLARLVAAIHEQGEGLLSYTVPADDTDGLSGVTVTWEIM